MRCIRRAFVVVLFAASTGILRAQSTNASLTGRVTDPSKAVVADAKVTAINPDTNYRYEASTDHSGQYYLSNLPPGSYGIEIEKAGFKTLITPDVILHVQDALAIDFELPLGSSSQTVTVQAGAPLVNTESAAVSTLIDRTFVDDLPLNGRSFQTLIMLTPGVVVSFSTGPDRRRSVTRAQRFGRDQQPRLSGCHAGVSHPNVFVCA
jgi:hypothetical protein